MELLVQCIAQLPLTPKTVLAMYYHENLELAEIAACLDSTDCEIEQIRAETVGLLQSMLAVLSQLDLDCSLKGSARSKRGLVDRGLCPRSEMFS